MFIKYTTFLVIYKCMILLYYFFFFTFMNYKLTVTSECLGRPSKTWDFCSSPFLLQLGENMLFIVRQTARARSVRSFFILSIELDTARFRLCPKQLNQGQLKLRTAALMLPPLSVYTQDTLLSSNPQSCRAS